MKLFTDKIACLAAVSMLVLFLSCTRNSPLSGTAVIDPALMRVEIKLDKNISTSDVATTWIRANLLDQNGVYIQLRNGSLSLNGSPMEVQYFLGTDAPYYFSFYGIYPDSLYVFTITLSNGSSCFASIITQKTDLYVFTVPARHKPTDTLTVSWLDTVGDADCVIVTAKTFTRDTVDTSSETFQITNPGKGSYTFPPSFFSSLPDNKLTSVFFQLQAVKNGTIDNRFKTGSLIYHRVIADKMCQIVDSL